MTGTERLLTEKIGKDEGGGGGGGGGGGLISNLISNLVPRSMAETGEEDINGDDKDEEKEGGFINHIIASFVSPLSPRPREVSTAVENGEKGISDGGGGGSNSEEATTAAAAGGGGGVGGLINYLISNNFNHSDEDGELKEDIEDEKPDVGEKNEQVKKGKEEEGGGGGFIHNLVSHLPASLSDI